MTLKFTYFFLFCLVCLSNLTSNEEIKKITKQINKRPNNSHLYHQRSKEYSKLKKYTEALNDIEKCIELNQNNDYFQDQRITFLLALNEFEKAEKVAAKIASQKNLDPNAYVCNKLLDLLDIEEAVLKNGLIYANKYINSHPNEFEGYRIKTIFYINLNDAEQATETAKTALEKFQTDDNAMINLANAYAFGENYDESKKLLIKSIHRKPQEAYAVNHIAYQLITYNNTKCQRPEKSLELAKQANDSSNQNSPDILDTYALALFKNNKIKEAIDTQQKAIDYLTEKLKKNSKHNYNPKIRDFKKQQQEFKDALKE